MEKIIKYLKSKKLHISYSSTEGWVYVSFKEHRIRIDRTMTYNEIKERLKPLYESEQKELL